tara:strand:+ start:30290 stop:31654 length:1365 start_codon:yes stop_codon:yes gene_type:complete
LVKDLLEFTTNKEILSFIKKLESGISHKEVYFFGVNFWPVIRLHIAFTLIQKNQQIQSNRKNKSNKSFFKKHKSTEVLKKQNQLFISHDNYIVEIDGKSYDRVLEKIIQDSSSPIIFNLADNSFYLNNSEKPFSDISKQVLIIKILSYVAGTVLRYFWIKKLKKLEILQTHERESRNSIVGGKSLSIRLCYIFFLSKYISLLLKRYKINQIYQGMYYDNFGLATSLASHNLGLVNNCVQHGGQSENNPAFGSWKVMSEMGYELLPDNFLCWDESSARSVDSWSINTSKHSSKVIGYGWMKLWKEDLSRKFNSVSRAPNNFSNVLVTLQPSVKIKDSFLYDFIKTSGLKVNWVLRVHPRQSSKAFIESIKEDFREVTNISITSTKDPLPLLLIHSDLHITFFSSSVYEAKYCDIKSVIIDKRGLDYFPDLIENGDVYLAFNAQDLKKMILENTLE